MYQNWFRSASESRSQITDTGGCEPSHQVLDRLTRTVLRRANTILYCLARGGGRIAVIPRGTI
jgi:hypothetical protein